MDMKVHVIRIDAAGKTKEQIEKEIAEQIAGELDVTKKAEEKPTEEKPTEEKSHIIIKAIEAIGEDGRPGYNINVDMNGKQGVLFNLLVDIAAQALSNMKGVDKELALNYSLAIFNESIKMLSEKNAGK